MDTPEKDLSEEEKHDEIGVGRRFGEGEDEFGDGLHESDKVIAVALINGLPPWNCCGEPSKSWRALLQIASIWQRVSLMETEMRSWLNDVQAQVDLSRACFRGTVGAFKARPPESS